MNDIVQEAQELLDLVLLRSEWQENEETFAECSPQNPRDGHYDYLYTIQEPIPDPEES